MIRSNTARTAMTPILLAILAGTAMSEPEGEQVVAGQASFLRDGGLTEITAADNTIINYQSFGVGTGETVRFIQPGENARVLNRVLGQDPSHINGSLIGNGRVYIVNEAGVFFGSQAIVSVGSIHAAAGTMTDADFLGGVDRFSGLTGTIENRGQIEAGEVHFAGRRVTNLGAIVAPEGLVTMSVGDEVLIGEYGGHLFVSAAGSQGEVSQQGEINAAGGSVLIGAGDMFSIAIGPGSTIQADQIDIRGGDGSIVTVAGSLDASNRSSGSLGGEVTVTGEGVAVLGADIDVSGDAGGGRVRIGGGMQGQDASIEHAERVNIDGDTTISADALLAGNGGEVVIWSDEATMFSGDITAKGGQTSGDGGFVEVSSTGWLGFFGHVNTAAVNGNDGLLLLDPVNINIVSGAAGSGADDALLDDNQLPASDSAGLDVQISDGTIEALTDTDILIAATGNIAIGILADGSLDLPVTAGNTFTFNAGDTFAAAGFGLITTQGGNVEIRGVNGIQFASLDAAGGDLFLESNGDIRSLRSLDNIGSFTANALGGSRSVLLTGLDAQNFSINADVLQLAGSIFSATDLDFSGLMRIESIDPSLTVTLAALDGTDPLGINIDPSTDIDGPGGMRFIADTLTLPAISGLSALEVTATQELILTGDIRMDNESLALGGRIDFSDAALVTLANDVRLDSHQAGRETLAGTINLAGTTIQGASAGAQTLIIAANDPAKASNNGTVVLGDVGGTLPFATLRILGAEVQLNGTITTQGLLNLSQVDSVNVTGDAVLESMGGNIQFGSIAIDGSGSLVMDLTDGMGGSGVIGLTNAIGATTPLESLTIIADAINLPDVTTAGDQTFSGNTIFLPKQLTSQGGTIDFDGKVNLIEDSTVTSIDGTVRFRELVAGSDDLVTITETGNTIFEKSVILGSLTARGDVNFDGSVQNIIVTNDIVLGEDVARDRIDMLAGTKSIMSTTGDVIFNGPLNGPAMLTIAAGTGGTDDDVPVIRFASNVGGAQSLSSLTLGSGRMSVPEVATIVSANLDSDGEPLSDQTFTFRTTGDFTMGQNEKLTALGSLLIESVSGIATVSDLTSVGPMRVNAGRIDVLSRVAGDVFEVDASQDPEALLDSAGRSDAGVDFVSGVSVIFDSPDIRISDDSLGQPVVTEPGGNVKIDGFQTRASEGFTLEEAYFNRRTGTGGDLIRDETTVLDARGLGSVTLLLAQALPSETTQQAAMFSGAQTLGAPNPESGELPAGDQGGILLRSTTAQERRSARDGVIWHIDIAENVNPEADDFAIASGRLNQASVRSFRRSWSELAGALGVDVNEQGEVLSRVRSVLGVAVDQYKRSSGEEFIDPQHFELFADLRSANSDAWQALQLVSAISDSADKLGMTPSETVRFRKGLFDSIRPEGLDSVDLDRLIEYAGQSDRQHMIIEAQQEQR
jgi:filamentous hemagglutinin family protein